MWPMTRRSNRDQELAAVAVLAEKLIALGYENHSCLRWRHRETGARLSRRALATMAHKLDPSLSIAYLESERFYNHLAFAACDVKPT